MTVAGWFFEHPSAVEAVRFWLRERAKGRGLGSRKMVEFLQAEHSYPFRDHTAFQKWAREVFPNIYAQAVTHKAPEPVSFRKTGADIKRLERHEDFFCTSAVSNCRADPGFLSAVERWRDDRQGKITVNPVRYANPRTRREMEKETSGEWWDPALEDYMLEDEIRPHEYLAIMTAKAQATANNPLPPRIDGRTKHRSAIFGHPQLAMRTVPTPQAKLPKLMYSSGAITEKFYSDTVSGDMADFHHSLAGVIAEIRGDRFHLREVIWDGQSFIDCDKRYYADRIEDAPPPLALDMGDIHVGLHAQNVMEATFEREDSIYNTLHPERVILHDLFDGKSVNPHEAANRLTRAANFRRGNTNLYNELRDVGYFLDNLPADLEVVVVPSNHDDFLNRWLQRGEKMVEPENLELYHRFCSELLARERATGVLPAALPVALEGHYDREVRFLKIDESFRLMGVELGMHGHLGPNGARGSVKNLARIGTRSIIGHGHGPWIWQGCNMVGMSAIYRHGYNVGPSGWLQSHTLLHANGYRQATHIVKNYWRG